MAASDMSERKSTATSGWVFADGIVAIAILMAGAFFVVWLSGGVAHPFLRAALSYLGSCLVGFLPILVFVGVVSAKDGEEPHFFEPPLSPLAYAIIYLTPVTLGAGVYYLIHYIVGVPSLVSLSEILGGFVVFGGGWGVVVTVMERKEERERKRERERKWGKF